MTQSIDKNFLIDPLTTNNAICQKLATLLKMNLLISIFQVFWLQFHLTTVWAAIFKSTSLSQSIFNGCFRYALFFCSIIQKIIKELIELEKAYFLNCRCYYLHIYSKLGTLKRSEIKSSIQYFSKPALNFDKCTRPEKDSATRL